MSEWIPVEERLPEKEGEYLVRFLNQAGDDDFYDEEIIRVFSREQILSFKKVNLNNKFTHWAHLPEMPKKKRWKPREDEKYFFISSDYDKIECRLWVNKGVYWNDECKRSFLGVYKTKEYAEYMRDKIKKLVESEIGEA